MWWKHCVAVVLVMALLRPGFGQGPVQEQVRKIAIGGALTVKMTDTRELHGHLSAIEPDSFTLREVDLNQSLTLRYSDVAQVTKGYGGKGFMGRRVNPSHRALIAVLLVGGLIALVFAAVASDKS